MGKGSVPNSIPSGVIKSGKLFDATLAMARIAIQDGI